VILPIGGMKSPGVATGQHSRRLMSGRWTTSAVIFCRGCRRTSGQTGDVRSCPVRTSDGRSRSWYPNRAGWEVRDFSSRHHRNPARSSSESSSLSVVAAIDEERTR
jgi:hypothetical protein